MYMYMYIFHSILLHAISFMWLFRYMYSTCYIHVGVIKKFTFAIRRAVV